MTEVLLPLSMVLAAYLVGAVPFGFLVARARGVDIMQQGSGNIGATNVGRVLGRRFGILVFVLDVLKGALPTWAAVRLAQGRAEELGPWLGRDGLPVLVGLAAFLGHLFPVYLRFRGGKGVATGAGVVAVLLPVATAAAALTWLAVVFLSHYVSLASLCAAVVLCVVRLARPTPFAADNLTLTLFCFFACILVFVRHRANLVRLVQGKESPIRGVPAVSRLVKTVHVLALGLWFGSAAFFNLIAAPAIFQAFRALADNPFALGPRGASLAVDAALASRLAGIAVAPLFPRFFLLEGVCGLLTALTALAWSRALPAERLHRLRGLVALAALAAVVAGWPLAQKVSALSQARYAAEADVRAAAESAFASWHAASLGLSLLTLVLVTVLMALAAHLPEKPAEETATHAG